MATTIASSGTFTSTGATVTLNLRSDLDWIRVYNQTAAGTAGGGTDLPFEFFFQRGMAAGTGLQWTKLDTVANDPVTVSLLTAPNGFTLVDTSASPFGAAVATTAYTNVVRPIVSTGSTAGLVTGSIVRLYGIVNGQAINGMDFAIDTIVANTSFRIASALATAPGIAGGAGFYRIVNYDPIYYPPFRYITNITSAASAVVTLSVPSQYQVGQEVTFVVKDPNAGMVEIDGLTGTITAVTDTVATQTITVDIDTTAFTAFTFPTTAQAAGGVNRPIVIPAGMDTAQALTSSVNILSDAMVNQAILGVRLAGGAAAGAAAGPAGAAGDVMFWNAMKTWE
jgi:hypothetical protein